jgi:ubiquitin carboxyl-terminal hydrolase 4/11
MPTAEREKEADEDMQEEGVKLQDCLYEFKQLETLDEDNMWYCNKCKEHVQATKTLEIFKVPKVLIITLKRFKQSKSKYS